MIKNLEKYKIKDATHKLICRHCCGRNYFEYYMKCIILKKMPNNRLKIIVFGDRYWKRDILKKRTRYVDCYRVIPKVF